MKEKLKDFVYKGVQLKHGMSFTAKRNFDNSVIKGCFNLKYRYDISEFLLICQNVLNGGHSQAERFGYKYGYILTLKLDGNRIIDFGSVFYDFELEKEKEPKYDVW
jgi:hypothetical protein